MDACLDTAPFGDEAAWTYHPTSGEIADGWLHGRGSSDSKAGAAIFAHVAARLRDTPGGFAGSVVLLFDVDEHTGGFGGAKPTSSTRGPIDGVMIGYPGLDHVVTGRPGRAARPRSRPRRRRAFRRRPGPARRHHQGRTLIRKLDEVPLPGPPGPEFPLPAKLTVTAISGGEGYSMVPDLCTLNVDIRLTPALTIRPPSRSCGWRQPAPTRRGRAPRPPGSKSLPGGRHTPCQRARRCATHCSARATPAGLTPVAKVAGPSNIGNYLARLGIPATAGFGVDYKNLHGTDERIRLDSIPAVQAAYHQALLTLLHAT